MSICKYPYSVQIRGNTDQKKVRNLDTFHAVCDIPTLIDSSYFMQTPPSLYFSIKMVRLYFPSCHAGGK